MTLQSRTHTLPDRRVVRDHEYRQTDGLGRGPFVRCSARGLLCFMLGSRHTMRSANSIYNRILCSSQPVRLLPYFRRRRRRLRSVKRLAILVARAPVCPAGAVSQAKGAVQIALPPPPPHALNPKPSTAQRTARLTLLIGAYIPRVLWPQTEAHRPGSIRSRDYIRKTGSLI